MPQGKHGERRLQRRPIETLRLQPTPERLRQEREGSGRRNLAQGHRCQPLKGERRQRTVARRTPQGCARSPGEVQGSISGRKAASTPGTCALRKPLNLSKSRACGDRQARRKSGGQDAAAGQVGVRSGLGPGTASVRVCDAGALSATARKLARHRRATRRDRQRDRKAAETKPKA